MKIVIINPNSNPDFLEGLKVNGENFANGRFEVEAVSSPTGPAGIDYLEDMAEALPGMMEIVRSKADADAFIVACVNDPNVDVLREITDKPVIGMGEASMKAASYLGHRFTLLSMNHGCTPYKEDLAKKIGLEGQFGPIRIPESVSGDAPQFDKLLDAAKIALERDLSEVIIVGGANMHEMALKLSEELGVPVLDSLRCALSVAEGLANMGVKTSKARKYKTRG